ncbi:MAG: adenosylcobinamide-GDP ribazoletransferase [Rubrobacteraceae bacterium]
MRALLSFFTTLPLRPSSLEEAARSVYLLPLVGLAAGLPGAVIVLLAYVGPPGVAATLALGAVLLVSGLHHADGVLDVGDALMVRGTAARRREVLKDARIGIGGLGTLFLVYAPSLAALVALAQHSPGRAALSLLVAETAARSVMVLVMTFSRPAEEGSSTVPFVRALKGRHRNTALVLALLAPLVVALPLYGLAPFAVLLVPLVALVSVRLAETAFGGISGDLVGASSEVGRAVLLVALSFTS